MAVAVSPKFQFFSFLNFQHSEDEQIVFAQVLFTLPVVLSLNVEQKSMIKFESLDLN